MSGESVTIDEPRTMNGRCPVCGGALVAGTSLFAVDLGFGVVVVRGVPALVCASCAEAQIEDEPAAKLEELLARAREQRTEFAVTHWREAVA